MPYPINPDLTANKKGKIFRNGKNERDEMVYKRENFFVFLGVPPFEMAEPTPVAERVRICLVS